jgi:general secretion pathway protein G
MKRPDQRGSLIEVMMVVVILGLLAAVTQALKLYRLGNTAYLSTEQSLGALAQRPTTQPQSINWKQGGYLDRVPKNPWGREYRYLNPGLRSEIHVFSLGADGDPGGEGNNPDIYF